jgi:hypothetical protein
VTGHDFTMCDCSDCHAALLDLQAELDELERTDPDVRAAAESYDRMVERITGRKMPQVTKPAAGRRRDDGDDRSDHHDPGEPR